MRREEFFLQILRIFYPGHRAWLVKTLVIAGLSIISRPFWEPIVTSIFEEYATIDIPNSDWAGWILLLTGISVYGLNEWVENSKKKIPKNKDQSEIETPRLSLHWSLPNSDDFNQDSQANYCSFYCGDTPNSRIPCRLISGGGTMPNNLEEIQAENYNIHKLTLTNHGNTPAFNISFPVTVECCKNDEDGNGYLVTTEISSFFGHKKPSVLPGETAIFYLHNSSNNDYWLNIHLMNYIVASVFNSEEKVKVNFTWESFRPLAITLK